ncbi:MAG: sodium/solute symporter [Candidatus Aminicenantes bacterium]|nr:sodium/solute symporter [Candidatus Aminicenantes bacterium]
MRLGALDIIVFLAFYAVVLGVSMYKSRRERTGEDYFLASRGLFWPLIGLSLIAANISSEHFVGMAGQGAGLAGMAIASYEWMAAITLVCVAFLFLPKFLKAGLFTIPEYLEYRYSPAARSIMAFYMMAIYVGVTIAAVIYSGGLTLQTLFGDVNDPRHLLYGVLVIGAIAAAYTLWGGLKAAAWADLFQGAALIAGGVLTVYVGFKAIGFKSFFEANADKLHMILPADHPVLPWTALVIGLWIPNFYYWGLNQYITQKTLAARSLREGQKGIIFAAFLKLLIPFIIILPGLMARQLYGHLMTGQSGTDAAYPVLIRNLIGPGARAFIFAAISGAVISSLAAMLNSASTIFTMDLYKRIFRRDAGDKALIRTGRISTLVFVTLGCLIAPQLGRPSFKGIFTYIQEFQGYVSPGILAVFIFGLLVKKAPPMTGVTGLLLTVPIYGALQLFAPQVAFLNRMAVTFVAILVVLAVMTALKPLAEPRVLPVREGYDMRPSRSVVVLGAVVVAATLALYAIFW